MPKQNIIQTAFTGGEFSPKLLARVDITKYASGAETVENFIIMPWGGARKRGGSRFVANTKGNLASRLHRFVFSTTQAYVIEFGINYFRIHSQDATVTEAGLTITGATAANPVVITSTAHGLSDTDSVLITGVVGMVEINNREFTVANKTPNTYELQGIDGSAFTAYSSAGTISKIVEVPTPYGASDLEGLDFTQSADTLYISHLDFELRLLTRASATSWALNRAAIVNGPFRDINTVAADTVWLTGGSATGYGTYAEGSSGISLNASGALFTADHVGGLFRLFLNDEGGGYSPLVGGSTTIAVNRVYENAGEVYAVTAATEATFHTSMRQPTHLRGAVKSVRDGNTAQSITFDHIHDGSVIVKVTAFTSDVLVEVTIQKNDAPAEVIGTGNKTSFWEEGAFSAERGWPGKVHLFEERLWLARTAAQPQTVWSSRTGAFLDFQDGEDDDRAITFTISSEQVDAIQWINGGRVLSMGTSDGEYVASAETPSAALTPADLTIRRQTRYGTADNIAPERVGEVLLFAQRYGDISKAARRVREHSFEEFASEANTGRDITILSDHITGTGITKFAYQASPWSVLWALREDGQVAGLTLERDQEVLAWHRHILGGVSTAGGAASVVESIATIPGDVGDDLWMIVKRWVNGGEVRHIERLTIGLDDDGLIADSQFLDSHLVYAGASTTTITGLFHLAGQTIRVFHSGEDQGTVTVSATGSVTLASSVTAAVLGLGYTAKLLSVRLEAGVSPGSTAQGKRKRISEATLRVYQSYGGKFGGEAARTDDIFGSTVALTTGDIRIEFPDGWNYDGRFYFDHDTGYPFTAIGIIAEVRGSG